MVENMPEEETKAGQELVAYLKNKYGISEVEVHKRVNATSCPGDNFPFNQIANATEIITPKPSEETGKISIAYNGEIESYTPDDFRKAFANIMAQTDVLSVDSTIGGMPVEE